MPATKLDLDQAVKEELNRIEGEQESAVEATVTATGVEAEISTIKRGWKISAFAKKVFGQKGVEAGAKVKREF